VRDFHSLETTDNLCFTSIRVNADAAKPHPARLLHELHFAFAPNSGMAL
jgi:hypothetical protein